MIRPQYCGDITYYLSVISVKGIADQYNINLNEEIYIDFISFPVIPN
jgi:hypothetical protein